MVAISVDIKRCVHFESKQSICTVTYDENENDFLLRFRVNKHVVNVRFDIELVLGLYFCSLGPTVFERYCFAVVTYSALEKSHAANVGVRLGYRFRGGRAAERELFRLKFKVVSMFTMKSYKRPNGAVGRARRRSKTIFFEQRPPRVDTVRNAFLPTFEPGQKYARV